MHLIKDCKIEIVLVFICAAYVGSLTGVREFSHLADSCQTSKVACAAGVALDQNEHHCVPTLGIQLPIEQSEE